MRRAFFTFSKDNIFSLSVKTSGVRGYNLNFKTLSFFDFLRFAGHGAGLFANVEGRGGIGFFTCGKRLNLT